METKGSSMPQATALHKKAGTALLVDVGGVITEQHKQQCTNIKAKAGVQPVYSKCAFLLRRSINEA